MCVFIYRVGQVKDNDVCVFIFISSDPSFIPSHVIPVFQALTGDWERIAGFLTRLIVVPGARAQLFRERFSVPDQRTEAGRYYALYVPDPSWKMLSCYLYRAGETEALQIARPHIQTVTGTYMFISNFMCVIGSIAIVCTRARGTMNKMWSCTGPSCNSGLTSDP